MSKLTACPLVWPEGYKRTPPAQRRRFAPYKVDLTKALNDLHRGLRGFNAIGVVISSNIPIRGDGRPYADVANPKDPGVALYFTRKSENYIFACDQFESVKHNMRAIGLTVEGLRMVERSGVGQMIDRAISGFAQLPAGKAGPVKRPWREVLNLEGLAGPAFAVKAAIDASYRELARKRHPDAGGSAEAMTELNVARDEALQEVAGV